MVKRSEGALPLLCYTVRSVWICQEGNSNPARVRMVWANRAFTPQEKRTLKEGVVREQHLSTVVTSGGGPWGNWRGVSVRDVTRSEYHVSDGAGRESPPSRMMRMRARKAGQRFRAFASPATSPFPGKGCGSRVFLTRRRTFPCGIRETGSGHLLTSRFPHL